ncbi:MAG: P22 coat - protein 5 family protein [Anaerolineae bacterium]|nr:P22 coat - protein 5 family protein [Anaerolineae bacterium]
MANTLTNLIPDAYAALDVVSRELVGFIPAVARDPAADRIAVGQTLRVGQTPANAAGRDATPAMSFPAASDQIIGNKSLTITKSRAFPFSWTGEEQKGVNAGPGFLTLKQDQIAQAIRAALNEMEADLAVAAYKGASRAYGTAGTPPFASDLSDTANVKKILDDNGTPEGDRHLVINTTAGVKIRTLTQLTKANEAADASLLRQGTLLDVHGFAFRESAKVQSHTKGTGAGYLVNGAHAVGVTTIAADTGTGTIVAGDVITIAGDSNKYVVKTALAAGSFVINEPGLLVAHADNDAITVGNNYSANIGFRRNSIVLATRLPALPAEGDMALDRETITDSLTGISLELAMYPGYRMIVYEVLVAWGVSVIKPEHAALLLG